ncbi:MAG TPA: TIGR00730 family Rossman fold protein [Puia sp.]|nr:TIGR00730 family Rossman fold protein [Puia sp.]
MQIRCVATFCGSKNGSNPLFALHTVEVAKYIALLKLKLIYGGGSTGLMGIMADTALAQGVDVTGVIPELLTEWEHHHKGLSQLAIVPDMHTRKRMMYERCDAAIILPGGLGTLDELFELLTWNQLRIHDKKIYLLNSGGFYNHMIRHLRHLEKEGFLYGDIEDRLIVCDNPVEIFNRLS